MKKTMICLLVSISLLMLSFTLNILVFPALGEEASKESYVEQLKSQSACSEIWYPVLSDFYKIESLTIRDNGSYTYKLSWNKTNVPNAFPASIAFVNSQPDGVSLQEEKLVWNSKYKMFWEQMGKDSFQLTAINGETFQILMEQQSIPLMNHNYLWVQERSGIYPYKQDQNLFVLHCYLGTQSGPSISLDGLYLETVIPLSSKQYFASCTVGRNQGTEVKGDGLEEFRAIRFATMGDANLNGEVNAVDALEILKASVRKTQITHKEAFALSDFDGNGILNADDALKRCKKP